MLVLYIACIVDVLTWFSPFSFFFLFSFLLVTKRGSVNACTSVAGKQLDGRQKGKLTLPDIRSLDPATKLIYLTV